VLCCHFRVECVLVSFVREGNGQRVAHSEATAGSLRGGKKKHPSKTNACISLIPRMCALHVFLYTCLFMFSMSCIHHRRICCRNAGLFTIAKADVGKERKLSHYFRFPPECNGKIFSKCLIFPPCPIYRPRAGTLCHSNGHRVDTAGRAYN